MTNERENAQRLPIEWDAHAARSVTGSSELDRLERESTPIPGRPGWRMDEDGREWYSARWVGQRGEVDVDGLLVAFGVVCLVVVFAVIAWHWLVGAGVVYAAYRHLSRGTRRRRPRSSWATIGKTWAAMYAAWNTRGLVHRNGSELRVSVPASAGAEHLNDDGIPF